MTFGAVFCIKIPVNFAGHKRINFQISDLDIPESAILAILGPGVACRLWTFALLPVIGLISRLGIDADD